MQHGYLSCRGTVGGRPPQPLLDDHSHFHADRDWTKPAALAIPKGGYFELERGRYGPVFPRTPACYGFAIIAKVKEGREDAIREHGKVIEAAIAETPEFLAALRPHYLRRLLFDVGDGLTFRNWASSTPT